MSAPRRVEMPQEDVQRMIESRKKAPTRDELRAAFPQYSYVETTPAGNREWVTNVPNWDSRGRRTKASLKLQEMFTPFVRSETSRARARLPREKEAVIDRNGSLHYLEPQIAKNLSRSMGLRPVIRLGGVAVVPGPDGMLFRWLARSWMPLGVSCLGTPLVGSPRVSRKTIQRDPSGQPWRWIDGEWVVL